ncbi:hypothetical protein [Thermofilum pendens]|uniref:Uncharacterized protein n=1 Tax=Thermofilum pendens (strain DSM 2475 / Hrk 5) TaxID=368408 RepID=A1RZN2_THEPD|nr:hypothetical protein [Thermofilum pendens]ABL78662.1 hypothetical protein Tpen_1264 [Thermofilum pendens Hrk 5]
MFSRYAALVKNLRGVVLLDPSEEGAKESLRWLAERFRYRNLGLTPAAAASLGSPQKPFRVLAYPLEEYERFAGELAGCAGLEKGLTELLVLSSLYVSPAILVGYRYREALGAVAVDEVRVRGAMGVQQWKLHLRIADYTVLDMYEYSVETAEEAVRSCGDEAKVASLLEERARRVAADKKRYWRVSSGEGDVFMYYVDNLRVYCSRCGSSGLCGRDWLAAALAVVPVVVVPPGMK